MDKKILVDTNILIKSYRGEDNKYQQLEMIKKQFAISFVTAFELLVGAKNWETAYFNPKRTESLFDLTFRY